MLSSKDELGKQDWKLNESGAIQNQFLVWVFRAFALFKRDVEMVFFKAIVFEYFLEEIFAGRIVGYPRIAGGVSL